MGMGALKLIRDRLADEGPDSIPPEHVREVEMLLADCWDRLSGGRREGMRGYKLVGRTEDMSWWPPTLTFGLERHGALVNGSTRAEVAELERLLAAAGWRRRETGTQLAFERSAEG